MFTKPLDVLKTTTCEKITILFQKPLAIYKPLHVSKPGSGCSKTHLYSNPLYIPTPYVFQTPLYSKPLFISKPLCILKPLKFRNSFIFKGSVRKKCKVV